MSTDDNTIVAVATPRGRAALGIVRLSGGEALRIVSECLDRPLKAGSFRRVESRLTLSRTAGFPVVLYVMLAGRSYTREDVVEIHAPGSPPLLAAILSEMRTRGARLAEPGEFTRRAFLNGRIDLAQAEAVMAIVRAGSETEERLALSALKGDLSRRVGAVRGELVHLMADIEAGLDFVEDEDIFVPPERQRRSIEGAAAALAQVLSTSAVRRLYREEAAAVLYGPANAGKSSIFNLLAGSPSAIVEDMPGTTRDFLEAAVDLEGVRFILVDTAGIRPPAELVEQIALEQSERAARDAQVVAFVVDASRVPDDTARRLYESARTLPHLAILNKCDLAQPRDIAAWRRFFSKGGPAQASTRHGVLELSAATGRGIDDLEAALAEMVLGGFVNLSGSRYLIDARQQTCLEHALAALERAGRMVETAAGDELTALEMRDAIEALGRVTGEDYFSDLLDEVFSRFCVGK